MKGGDAFAPGREIDTKSCNMPLAGTASIRVFIHRRAIHQLLLGILTWKQCATGVKRKWTSGDLVKDSKKMM